MRVAQQEYFDHEKLHSIFHDTNMLVYPMNDSYFSIEGNNNDEMFYAMDSNWEQYSDDIDDLTSSYSFLNDYD